MIPRLNIGFSMHRQCLFWLGKHPYVPLQGEYLLNHARTGIVMMLKTALPKGGRVGMMAYNCHTIMNAIEKAGCQPVFIDVQENLRIDIKSLNHEAKHLNALIVSHLFGLQNDMEQIRKICPNILIIEDCAHGWGMELSEYADAVVYSINQGKFPSIGEGGILKVQPEWQVAIDTMYASLPHYSFVQSLKLFLTMQVKALLYKPLLYTYFTLPLLKKNKSITNVHQPVVLKKMNIGIQRILGATYVQVKTEIQKQRANAEHWKENIKECPYIDTISYGENAFMIVCHCSNVVDAKHWMQEHGVETETHFKHCIEWASAFGYKRGLCPTAERLTTTLLMSPTYK